MGINELNGDMLIIELIRLASSVEKKGKNQIFTVWLGTVLL